MKSLISNISSFVLIAILLLQVSMMTVVGYLYVNHNEKLTASCCINKGVDDSCKAKCFFNKTEKQEKENQSISVKKSFIYLNTEPIGDKIFSSYNLIGKHRFQYLNQYTFLASDYLSKPPIA